MTGSQKSRAALPLTGTRGPLVFAVVLTVFCLGGATAWSSMVQLESAAMASGVLVFGQQPQDRRASRGRGRCADLVHEHDRVEAGQVLIRLDPTVARAALDLYQGNLIASEALIARLSAERDLRDDIVFPTSLAGQTDPRATEIMAAERRVFTARREQLQGQAQILQQKSVQFDEQIRGLSAQIKAEDLQLRLIGEEVGAVQQMVAKGLEPKPKLLALQRQSADIEGMRGQNIAKVAETKQQQGESQLLPSSSRANPSCASSICGPRSCRIR